MDTAIAAPLWIRFNWTTESLALVMLAMFITEYFRILGRASDPLVPRKAFDWGHYIRQGSNWGGLVVSLACSMSLLAFRDGVIDMFGLAVKNPVTFAPLYAFGVGAFGQSLVKLVLKGLLGMFGAFGRAEKE